MITPKLCGRLLSFFKSVADICWLNNSAKDQYYFKTKINSLFLYLPEFFSAMTTVDCRSWAAMNASRNSIGTPLPWLWLGLLNRIKKTNSFHRSIFSLIIIFWNESIAEIVFAVRCYCSPTCYPITSPSV